MVCGIVIIINKVLPILHVVVFFPLFVIESVRVVPLLSNKQVVQMLSDTLCVTFVVAIRGFFLQPVSVCLILCSWP